MRFELAGAPARFEELNEVGGADDVDAQSAHKLHCAGVDHGDVGHGALGRILHGDAVSALHHAAEAVRELLPAGVENVFPGQSGEGLGFNLVSQSARLAVGGDEIEPAARDHGAGGEFEHAVGDGIAIMMVEEEPAVQGLLAQRGLNFREPHTVPLLHVTLVLKLARPATSRVSTTANASASSSQS